MCVSASLLHHKSHRCRMMRCQPSWMDQSFVLSFSHIQQWRFKLVWCADAHGAPIFSSFRSEQTGHNAYLSCRWWKVIMIWCTSHRTACRLAPAASLGGGPFCAMRAEREIAQSAKSRGSVCAKGWQWHTNFFHSGALFLSCIQVPSTVYCMS